MAEHPYVETLNSRFGGLLRGGSHEPDGEACADDQALEREHLIRRNADLEREVARLRLALQDGRRSLALAPDVKLSKSAWLRVWGEVTVKQIFTKSVPRMAIIMSVSAGVAYLVAR